MNSVTLTGIAPSESNDNRTKLILSVVHEGEHFDWVLRMPSNFSDTPQEYVNLNADTVHADIAAKLIEWENLEPKTRTIEDFIGESVVVDITRDEIVKPTYPDYYILRAREYPVLSEQFDALWKGGDAAAAMISTIAAIKAKYPKE